MESKGIRDEDLGICYGGAGRCAHWGGDFSLFARLATLEMEIEVALKTSRPCFPSSGFSGSAALATFASQLAIRRHAKRARSRGANQRSCVPQHFSVRTRCCMPYFTLVRDLDDSLAFYEALGLLQSTSKRRWHCLRAGKLRDKENFALELASAKDPEKPLQQGGISFMH